MTKPETLTPTQAAPLLTARHGRRITYRQILRRLNQKPPVPGAINRGSGRRSLWEIPNTSAALDALLPNRRGRPAGKAKV